MRGGEKGRCVGHWGSSEGLTWPLCFMVAWLTQGSASESVCLRSCGLDGHWEVVPRGVSGAVSPQWIPLWFLTLLSRLHYMSREKTGRQLSQTPFGWSPPRPLTSGFVQLGPKKSSGWGGSDHGSQGGEEGIGEVRTGTGIICMSFWGGKEKWLKGKKGRGHLEKFGIQLKAKDEWIENAREEDRSESEKSSGWQTYFLKVFIVVYLICLML